MHPRLVERFTAGPADFKVVADTSNVSMSGIVHRRHAEATFHRGGCTICINMSDDTPIDALLTVNEAARLLRVAPITIRRWCLRGELAAFKTGPARNAQLRIPAGVLVDRLQVVGRHERSTA
jgi:excisionase family DNA binding protein